MNKIVPGLLIAASLLYTSCADEYTICESPVNVTLNADFYRNNGTSDVLTQPGSFSLTTLSGISMLTNVSNRSGFQAPLNPVTDTAGFILSIEGNIPDTFKVAYTTQVQTVSANCGNVNIYTVSAVSTTHHIIDSIKLVNPAVNTLQQQNIRIFY
ncbi:DUF6452 family protein [Ferruginibacter sp. HRS2-29]|uniref:DUF6452 family protein n=1 Tax=Ferruginibacter sp. HRS2-29 TaxID=2487334 RepID=UPI0020CEDD2A|nr:DUF6452 family protein [Ferruginibacter sp. HRS2-29]MCP9752739.1 hypothetical protein [Ferruginibacter sp. HRS2-29]